MEYKIMPSLLKAEIPCKDAGMSVEYVLEDEARGITIRHWTKMVSMEALTHESIETNHAPVDFPVSAEGLDQTIKILQDAKRFLSGRKSKWVRF